MTTATPRPQPVGEARDGGPDPGEIYAIYRRRNSKLMTSRLLVGGIVLAAFSWAVWGTGFGVLTLVEGFAASVAFIVTDLFPPRLEVLPQFIGPAFDTLVMSYVAVLITVALSVPFGVLAARSTVANRAVTVLARGTIALIRAVPEIVLAIFLVAVFGIGPLAGALAMGVGGVGLLAKAYADALETIDDHQLEGVRATGASWLQVFTQAVWPQFKPSFITWSLYKFELNIRTAAVLGLVGAGGLGYSLSRALSLFQFRTATTIILMIFLMVLLVETVTGALRRRIL